MEGCLGGLATEGVDGWRFEASRVPCTRSELAFRSLSRTSRVHVEGVEEFGDMVAPVEEHVSPGPFGLLAVAVVPMVEAVD